MQTTGIGLCGASIGLAGLCLAQRAEDPRWRRCGQVAVLVGCALMARDFFPPRVLDQKIALPVTPGFWAFVREMKALSPTDLSACFTRADRAITEFMQAYETCQGGAMDACHALADLCPSFIDTLGKTAHKATRAIEALAKQSPDHEQAAAFFGAELSLLQYNLSVLMEMCRDLAEH